MPKINLPIKKHSNWRVFKRRLRKELYIREYFDASKCIFVHIPKSAGTSVKNALFPNTTGPGHRMAMDYYLENPRKFNNYFVFAFVRNPFDRLVSAYTYLSAGGNNPADQKFCDDYLGEFDDFKDFVKNGLHRPEINNKWHFRPQHYYVVNHDGEVIVDFIGKLENIDEDFKEVCRKLKKNIELPHNNKSKRSTSYVDYYDEETRAIAVDFYNLDFALFEYDESLTLSS